MALHDRSTIVTVSVQVQFDNMETPAFSSPESFNVSEGNDVSTTEELTMEYCH